MKELLKQLVVRAMLIFFVSLSSTCLLAQSFNPNDPIPASKTIRKGVLENGLTYYIKSTDVVKNAASYYIIQNVGSILENENQLGLAHFLEHMAFNGTQHFAGKGILNTLQRHGALFGRDINAYTSFDETVYNLTNIPTNKPGLVDTCILILHDWADGLLLTDKEIDAERGVIKEEWRTRQSGSLRIAKQFLASTFYKTIYKDRMPIGSMDIVENFQYQTIKDFYQDWYRPDLQAIAIIGDINVDEVEAKIKAAFSTIQATKNPRERINVIIPDNDQMVYNLAMDKEVVTPSISFSIRHTKPVSSETMADFRENILKQAACSMIAIRLNDIAQLPDAPFISARLRFGGLNKTSSAFDLGVTPKSGKQYEAFEAALTEVMRALKHGFTEGELARFKSDIVNSYERLVISQEDFSHIEIVSEFKNNYLNKSTIIDYAMLNKRIAPMMAEITLQDVHAQLKKLYTPNNRVLNVLGVEGSKNLSEKDALDMIKKVEEDATLKPYTESFAGKTLMDGVSLKGGKIEKEIENKAPSFTTFVLSNGIKVHYRYSDVEKNSISLNANSWGGTSLIKDTQLPSAYSLPGLVRSSGVGNYTRSELQKLLAGKNVDVSVYVSNISESISGNSTTTDIEAMLQLIYLQFANPRFDQKSFDVMIEQYKNSRLDRSKRINSVISDSLTIALFGNNNPQHRLFDESYIQNVSFADIVKIYNERFNNAADFEFYIVGDVDKKVLTPLLEKYIASLPTNSARETYVPIKDYWINSHIKRRIELKMEDPKASVKIGFENNIPFNKKDQYLAYAIGDLLTLRFTETLREQEGGTYGAGASGALIKRPIELGKAAIGFDCNPEKVDVLVRIVYAEIEKLKRGEISSDDLNKTLSNYRKGLTDAKNRNGYFYDLMYNYQTDGYNAEDPANNLNIINAITTKEIAKYAKKMFKNARSYEVIFMPLNTVTK